MLDVFLVTFSSVDLSQQLLLQRGSGTQLTIFRSVRIFKVVRILRMVRAVRFVQELRLMLDCCIGSLLGLFWCLVLITFVLYMFSLVFVQGLTSHVTENLDMLDDKTTQDVKKLFGRVTKAMVSLFQSTTGGIDWHIVYELVNREGHILGPLFLFFIAFFVIAAWNIVTSTFVDKALKLAIPDIEDLVQEKRQRDMTHAKELTNLLSKHLDMDGDGIISLGELQETFSNSMIREFMAVRGIDFKDAEAFFEMLTTIGDAEDGVPLQTFVAGCLRLRGMATSLDLQTLHFNIMNILLWQSDCVQRVEDLVDGLVRGGVRYNGVGGAGDDVQRPQCVEAEACIAIEVEPNLEVSL